MGSEQYFIGNHSYKLWATDVFRQIFSFINFSFVFLVFIEVHLRSLEVLFEVLLLQAECDWCVKTRRPERKNAREWWIVFHSIAFPAFKYAETWRTHANTQAQTQRCIVSTPIDYFLNPSFYTVRLRVIFPDLHTHTRARTLIFQTTRLRFPKITHGRRMEGETERERDHSPFALWRKVKKKQRAKLVRKKRQSSPSHLLLSPLSIFPPDSQTFTEARRGKERRDG